MWTLCMPALAPNSSAITDQSGLSMRLGLPKKIARVLQKEGSALVWHFERRSCISGMHLDFTYPLTL